jgi:hypothetical protein
MNGGSSSNNRGHPFCYDVLTQGAGAQTLSCKCGHKYVAISLSLLLIHSNCMCIVVFDCLQPVTQVLT